MAKVVTIPNHKSFVKEKELVLIPRREYETLLRMRARVVPEIPLTARQKRAIRASERELKQGAYLTLGELAHALGRTRAKTSR